MDSKKSMRVHVRKNALELCKARVVCGGPLPSPSWTRILETLQEIGWIEVETTHLFSDQFNTVPFEGCAQGVRLMLADIDAIENDVRPGVSKCVYCYSDDREERDGICPRCCRRILQPMLVQVPPEQWKYEICKANERDELGREADKGFDGGEFSNAGHDRMFEAEVDRILAKYGKTREDYDTWIAEETLDYLNEIFGGEE